MRHAALLLLLVAAASLRAEGLADLRAALQKLQATQPVKATAECQSWSRSGKSGKEKITQGQARARLEDGPHGLQLGWDKAELLRVAAASKAKDAGPKQAMDLISGEKAKDLLDAASALLEELQDAQIQEDKPDTWNSKPARLLAFKIEPKDMDAEDRKHIKAFSSILKVWMDADGTPLAAARQMDLKGSFLLISFEAHESGRSTFARLGDRLVAVHQEEETAGSGAGQQGSQKRTIDLKL